jgi:ribose 5-phosphate isomerase A
MANDKEKELARRAGAALVRDGDVVGLGTGSTAFWLTVALGERVKQGLRVSGIATSVKTEKQARELGVLVTTLDEHPQIDIDIDGADELDPQLNLIKGGGGALLREKVIAAASKKMVVIADSSKLVPVLGKFPLPIEIVPFARAVVEKKIKSLGAEPKLRLKDDGSPYITDNGNQILDCNFGKIADPPALARTLSEVPGILEHGLFIGLATLALIGTGNKVEEIHRKPRKPARKPRQAIVRNNRKSNRRQKLTRRKKI